MSNADFSKREQSYRFNYVGVGGCGSNDAVDFYHEWSTFQGEKVSEVMHMPLSILRRFMEIISCSGKHSEIITSENHVLLRAYNEKGEVIHLQEEIKIEPDGIRKAVEYWIENGEKQHLRYTQHTYTDFSINEKGEATIKRTRI